MGQLVAVGKANRDQNSSIGATVIRRGPQGPGLRPTLQTRTGHFAGKTRGVGRKEAKDQNSSPRVTRVQPRHPNGRWVSHENDLKVIHPVGRFSRQPKTSALGIHHKGRGAETRGYVEKARGMKPSALRSLMSATQPTKVTGRAGKSLEQSARVTEARKAKAYGKSNTRFGSAGSRGRRLTG